MDKLESSKNRNETRPEHIIDEQNKSVAIAERETEVQAPVAASPSTTSIGLGILAALVLIAGGLGGWCWWHKSSPHKPHHPQVFP